MIMGEAKRRGTYEQRRAAAIRRLAPAIFVNQFQGEINRSRRIRDGSAKRHKPSVIAMVAGIASMQFPGLALFSTPFTPGGNMMREFEHPFDHTQHLIDPGVCDWPLNLSAGLESSLFDLAFDEFPADPTMCMSPIYREYQLALDITGNIDAPVDPR